MKYVGFITFQYCGANDHCYPHNDLDTLQNLMRKLLDCFTNEDNAAIYELNSGELVSFYTEKGWATCGH